MKQISEQEADQLTKMRLLKEYKERVELEYNDYVKSRDKMLNMITIWDSILWEGRGMLGILIVTAYFFATYVVPLDAYIGMGIVLLYVGMSLDCIRQGNKAIKQKGKLRNNLNRLRNNYLEIRSTLDDMKEEVLRICNREE